VNGYKRERSDMCHCLAKHSFPNIPAERDTELFLRRSMQPAGSGEPDPIDFATNLWDCFEICIDRMKIALKTFEELKQFLKERASIEERASTGMKALCAHTGQLPEEGSVASFLSLNSVVRSSQDNWSCLESYPR